MVNLRQQSKVINKKKTYFRYCSQFVCTNHDLEVVSEQRKAGCQLFSPQSSLVILCASGMYGMLASAHKTSQKGVLGLRLAILPRKYHTCLVEVCFSECGTTWQFNSRNCTQCKQKHADKASQRRFITRYMLYAIVILAYAFVWTQHKFCLYVRVRLLCTQLM